jgi:hypothetical protein
MALRNSFLRLLSDPLPEYVFEISEAGIAWTRPGSPQLAFQPLEPGTIAVSPLADNIHKADALADTVRAIAGGGSRKRRTVLILPDYCARVSVLEFDNLPSDPKEAISYCPQAKSGSGAIDVIVVVAALEIVARYEAPFRAAGLHPGLVTTSLMAMTELNPYTDISVLARLNGKALTVAVMNGSSLKLVRSMELPEMTSDEILAVLLPTLAYVEDEMGTKASRLLTCGFDNENDWQTHLDLPVVPLQSSFGTPTQWNAGLLGYLQSIRGGAKAA